RHVLVHIARVPPSARKVSRGLGVRAIEDAASFLVLTGADIVDTLLPALVAHASEGLLLLEVGAVIVKHAERGLHDVAVDVLADLETVRADAEVGVEDEVRARLGYRR